MPLRLERQAIVLTVPASFNEEARELTVRAARDAGFERLTLLEEPLAALYAWIAAHRRELRATFGTGSLILVCDVGGGTTDFSLIRARVEADDLTFERIAIGEHLLLGGDNLDLALAVAVEQKLGGSFRTDAHAAPGSAAEVQRGQRAAALGIRDRPGAHHHPRLRPRRRRGRDEHGAHPRRGRADSDRRIPAGGSAPRSAVARPSGRAS